MEGLTTGILCSRERGCSAQSDCTLTFILSKFKLKACKLMFTGLVRYAQDIDIYIAMRFKRENGDMARFISMHN